ncbi:OLC1v1038386C1 [Oldenlandia corymbosa var. corymbosa]|uniref:OLC1v1038386C1 n=1 Tax=Oldenlandia corymbosa var. corymbosa TaxID=529605 RepID=A0AAV1D2Q9_OLDCO|nr:OLC1v1038386C1 [Oldenlandia corymbosa var. corymbosa]
MAGGRGFLVFCALVVVVASTVSLSSAQIIAPPIGNIDQALAVLEIVQDLVAGIPVGAGNLPNYQATLNKALTYLTAVQNFFNNGGIPTAGLPAPSLATVLGQLTAIRSTLAAISPAQLLTSPNTLLTLINTDNNLITTVTKLLAITSLPSVASTDALTNTINNAAANQLPGTLGK